MNGAGGAAGPSEEERNEDLPQSDGTCDACEPDEAQTATQVCHTCNFAFCTVHGNKHQRSTRHMLQPYSQQREPAPAQGGGREEVAAGGGDVVGGAEGTGTKDKEAGLAPPREAGKNRDTVTVERLRCKVHGQEGSLYCRNDEKVICVVCAIQGEHSSHEIITLREGYLWQKNKGGIDLLTATQEMSKRIKSKWNSPEMNAIELEFYVEKQFAEMLRLVRLEERRTLHLVDLKEAFLTALAAEKMAEINMDTERLQEEVDSITQQLEALDREEKLERLEKMKTFEQIKKIEMLDVLGKDPPGDPGPAPPLQDVEARPRPNPRPDRPRDHRGGGSGSFMEHAP